MKKRIVLALGGNALGNSLTEQMEAVKTTAKAIAGLVEAGNEVVIAHGNGPQVGMINLAMEAGAKSEEAQTPYIPMSVCVAMSQGYIGYDLQNALREELVSRGLDIPVATIISQTIVDGNDPAFKDPTKPIGSFYSEEEAKEMIGRGYNMKEDAGRGWRRVVASPKPIDIVEKETVKVLLNAGQVVVAAGGGGIPVRKEGNSLNGAAAVVDKDFASSILAQMLDADFLIILTAVEKVAVNFRKPDEKWLDTMTLAEAQKYIDEGQFAPGSMLPKVQAAMEFAASKPGRKSLITLLEKAEEGIAGKTGTTIISE